MSESESKKQRSEKLRAAAIDAMDAAFAMERDATSIMAERTGEHRKVCNGYIVSSPNYGAYSSRWAPIARKKAAEDYTAKVAGRPVVVVRRQWNDTQRKATYLLSDISGMHFSDISGGIQAPAPKSFLHGYVLCDGMLDGELAHSCAHGKPPHLIKVCITKVDNSKEIYRKLLSHLPAEQKPDIPEWNAGRKK